MNKNKYTQRAKHSNEVHMDYGDKVRAKKNLGQHFLTDLSIAERIADTLQDFHHLPCLEVGPGMGVLTQFLIEKGYNLKVVELDGESVSYLRLHYPSVKYRQAKMKVLDSQHNVEKYEHELNRSTAVFASKCGIDFEGDAMAFLPDTVPASEPVDVLSFDKKNYVQIESATWTNYVNTLSRNAEKAFTLSGNAGYTFNNTSLNNDDSVDLGLNFAMDKKALELSMGTSFSVENAEPVYKFGINLNPTGFLLSNIEKEQKSINEQKELNAVANAVKKYETSVVSQQSALSDLLWEKAKIEENYSLYADLERDTYSWFKKGIVTESTYRESLVNKDSYRIKKLINDIDFLLYNNTTKLLFTRDEELK